MSFFLMALLLVSTAALAAIVGWFVWHYEYQTDLPNNRQLVTVSAAERICSSGGERTFVPLAAIPPIVRNAFLAAEEPDFYDRSPINPFTELAGAALFNRKPRSSAISTTVVRCLMSLTPECCKTTFDRHIGNAVLMRRVEKALSKDLIFELYLNEVWLGRRAYGAGAAANAYFGKLLSNLTLDEAAYIAALPRAPSVVGRDSEYETGRRNFVIDRMREAGAISPAQAASAKRQPPLLLEVPAPI